MDEIIRKEPMSMEGQLYFKQTELETLACNPFSMIGKEWYLLTAGTPDHFNMMTASWGFVGEMWGVPSFQCVVRTNRHTLQFLEEQELFTISFFDSAEKPALQFCGTHSGRDYDKVKETGLQPVILQDAVTFAQAKRVFVCRKMYSAMMQEDGFLDPETYQKWYETKGEPMHRQFIGEIRGFYQHI